MTVLANMTGGSPIKQLYDEIQNLPVRHYLPAADEYDAAKMSLMSGVDSFEKVSPVEPDLIGQYLVLCYLAPKNELDNRAKIFRDTSWSIAPLDFPHFLAKLDPHYVKSPNQQRTYHILLEQPDPASHRPCQPLLTSNVLLTHLKKQIQYKNLKEVNRLLDVMEFNSRREPSDFFLFIFYCYGLLELISYHAKTDDTDLAIAKLKQLSGHLKKSESKHRSINIDGGIYKTVAIANTFGTLPYPYQNLAKTLINEDGSWRLKNLPESTFYDYKNHLESIAALKISAAFARKKDLRRSSKYYNIVKNRYLNNRGNTDLLLIWLDNLIEVFPEWYLFTNNRPLSRLMADFKAMQNHHTTCKDADEKNQTEAEKYLYKILTTTLNPAYDGSSVDSFTDLMIRSVSSCTMSRMFYKKGEVKKSIKSFKALLQTKKCATCTARLICLYSHDGQDKMAISLIKELNSKSDKDEFSQEVLRLITQNETTI